MKAVLLFSCKLFVCECNYRYRNERRSALRWLNTITTSSKEAIRLSSRTNSNTNSNTNNEWN